MSTETLLTLTKHKHRNVSKAHTKLYHVGDLGEPRAKPYFSQEGGELSVSPCPSVWRKITELSGKTHELTKNKPVFYEIDPETSVTNTELRVCCENKFIRMVEGYKVSRHDFERDVMEYWKFYSRDEAINFIKEHDWSNSEVVSTMLPKMRSRGKEYWDAAFTQPASEVSPIGVESLVPIWSLLPLSESGCIDGVFWTHPLKPESYTAPRGLIFQSKLSEWYRQSQLDEWGAYCFESCG